MDDLIAADDSEMRVMSMLRHRDAQESLIDKWEPRATEPDALEGPFAHIRTPAGDRDRNRILREWLGTHRTGPEFDFVVLVEPDRPGDGLRGAVDRYVAMTRATQELVLLTTVRGTAPSRRL
jgi:hypothetical protein